MRTTCLPVEAISQDSTIGGEVDEEAEWTCNLRPARLRYLRRERDGGWGIR